MSLEGPERSGYNEEWAFQKATVRRGHRQRRLEGGDRESDHIVPNKIQWVPVSWEPHLGTHKVWAEAIWRRSCGCRAGEVAPRSRSSAVLSEDALSSQRPRQAAHNCCNSSSWGSHTLSGLHGTGMHSAHISHRHVHKRKNKSFKEMATDFTFWSLVPKELHNIYSIVYNREWWFKSHKRRVPHRFYFLFIIIII